MPFMSAFLSLRLLSRGGIFRALFRNVLLFVVLLLSVGLVVNGGFKSILRGCACRLDEDCSRFL